VRLKDISNALRKNIPLPLKAVAVKLDGGFMDNYQNAFPTHQEYEVLATIFLTLGMIGRTNLWLQKDGISQEAYA
jgi:peptidoglycan/xylan/chitin deacetylase (PgdA/CDA1 family)